MKFLRVLMPFVVLGMALCVTTASIYVTVNAAAQPPQGAEAAEKLPPVPAQEDAFEAAAESDEGTPVFDEAAVPLAPVPVPEASQEGVDPESLIDDRQQRIGLNADGGFNGRLSSLSRPGGNMIPAAGVLVRIVQDGVQVASAVTDPEGAFSFSGLSEGVVGLIAKGDDALLLMGLHLISAEPTIADATLVKLETATLQLDMNSAVVSGPDLPVATDLIFNNLPDRDQPFVGDLREEERKPGFRDGVASTALVHHQVQLEPDGSLAGQVELLDPDTGGYREVVDLTVHFIRDGAHVTSTKPTPDGGFSVAGLSVGTYSVVTTGSDGTAALGIDVIGAIAQVDSKYSLTSVAAPNKLSLCPVDAKNFNSQNASALVNDARLAVAEATPASPSNQSSGGGGGGGGDDGLGLLGLLAGGAIGALLADKNDKVASPAR